MKTFVKQLSLINTFVIFAMLSLSVPAFASEPVTVKIPVHCDAKNISSQFAYTITATEDDAPMPDVSVITLKNGEDGEFVIKYDEPNTWHYEIKQEKVIPEKEGIIYDKTVYRAIVLIGVKTDEKLYSELSISKRKSNTKSSTCLFDNESSNLKGGGNIKDPNIYSAENPHISTPVYPIQTKDMSNVQTGDTAMPLLYMFVIIICSAFISVFYNRRRDGR